MAIDDLPRALAFRLAELAADIREGHLVTLEDGRPSGEQLEFLAAELIEEGLASPSSLALVTPPRFRSLDEALPLFESLLEELACPSVAELEAWWPEDRFEELFPRPAPVVGRSEGLWFHIGNASPPFAVVYDAYETDYYNAILFAQEFVRLLETKEHDVELRDVVGLLVEGRNDDQVREIVELMIFDCLVRNLAGVSSETKRAFGGILEPQNRLVWDQLTPS